MVPFVISSAIGGGRNTNIGSSSFSSATVGQHVRSVYNPPQVLVDVIISQGPDGLLIQYCRNAAAFPPGLHEDILATLLQLAAELSADTTKWTSSRLATIPRDQAQLFERINSAHRPIPSGLLVDSLITVAGQAPTRVAVVTPDLVLTYGELLRYARGAAAKLQQMASTPLAPNACVGVMLLKSAWMSVAVHAIHLNSAAYVPIDPALPIARVRTICMDAQICVMCTSMMPMCRVSCPDDISALLLESIRLDLAAVLPARQQTPVDRAYVIFTSGSTGRPKGVVLNHRGPKNTCADVNTQHNVTHDDVAFGISSLGFDLSVYDLFGSTQAGGTLVYPKAEDARNPLAWQSQLRQERVTIWNSAPALMQLLLDTVDGGEQLPDLRLVMLSGDWIPPSMPDRIRALAPRATVVSLGGATEASIWSIWFEIPSPVPTSWSSIPYGHAMANQSWHVLDDELCACPAWVPGELYIGGIGLAEGYLCDVSKTTASFILHPQTQEMIYRTGDLGRWQADGEIEFLGRKDFQVKIGGFRVELGEIEHALRSQPGVQEAVLQALGERDDRYLAAWIKPSCAQVPCKDQLQSALRLQLPHYMVPNVLVFVETFPVTSNGKLDRTALQVPREDQPLVEEVPTSEHEEGVLAVFRQFLRADVGPRDNFFEAGGSSLKAMQMAVVLRREFGVTLGIGDIVSAPTVKELAQHLSGGQSKQWSPLVALRREGDLQPIFLVHPAGGQVASYRGLLEHLPTRQPLYAFEAAGLTGEGTPDSTLEEMATPYVEAIRSVSHGPYTIGGWSSGGLIAFDVARQLIDVGEEVSRLVLIDTPAPHVMRPPHPDELLAWFLDDLQLGYDVDALDMRSHPPSPGQELTRLEAAIEQLGPNRLPMAVDSLMPMFSVFSSVILGSMLYAPPTLPVEVELIRARTQIVREYATHPCNDANDWGWIAYLKGGAEVTVHWLDGTHYTLLGESTVPRVAAILEHPAPTRTEAAPSMADSAWEMCDLELARARAEAEAQYDLSLPLVQGFSADALQEVLQQHFGAHITDADMSFTDAGLSSLQAVRMRNALQNAVGARIDLPVPLLMMYTSLRALTSFFEMQFKTLEQNTSPGRTVARTAESSAMLVCVGGASCKLPGGVNLDSLRRLASTAHDTASLSPFRQHDLSTEQTHGFFLETSQLFAAGHFSISAGEARDTDPQQRHVLEESYAALHASGARQVDLRGSTTGVVVGIWKTHFATQLAAAAHTSLYNTQNISISVASGRVSFVLDLHGPCTSLDTACSSGLVAAHCAMSALERSECEQHVVSGVNLVFYDNTTSVVGMTSYLGRCHSFDRRADGYAAAEACASFVLRTNCNCVVKSGPQLCAAAAQQDGRSASLTAPNGPAQARLLKAVHAEAGVVASNLALLEAHATGTPLGDPIETRSIATVAASPGRETHLPLNCLKANVAHSETGAGVTGLLALTFSMATEAVMPNAQLRALNPHITEVLNSYQGIALPTQCLAALPLRHARQTPRSNAAALVPRSSASPSPPTLFDASSVKALRNSLAQTSTAALQLNLIRLGAELGFWTSLCGRSQTCSELARRTTCDERYTKEWCLAMAAGGMLQYAKQAGTFSIPRSIQTEMRNTKRLISVCDLTVVTQDHNQLLQHCREPKSSENPLWIALCSPHPRSTARAPVPASGLFVVESSLAFWNSLEAWSTAVKRLHLIGLGCDTGWWSSLCSGPKNSSQLAQMTGCDSRCTAEWCDTMAVSGILEGSDNSSTFSVPQHAQPLISNIEALYAACNLSQLKVTPRLKMVFQEGGGIPWGQLNPEIAACTCCTTAATYNVALLPSLPAEIIAKLKAGGSIADVGCGQGTAACMLAEQFPGARVHGYDYHAPSIEAAVCLAEEKGLKNVHFAVSPSDDFAADASHDVLCFLDCFHDMAVATRAATHAYRVLKPDGMLFLVEPMAAELDSVAEQIKIPTAVSPSLASNTRCDHCDHCDHVESRFAVIFVSDLLSCLLAVCFLR